MLLSLLEYLELQDHIQFVAVSRKIRKLFPIFLKRLNYKPNLEKYLEMKANNWDLHVQAERLVERQQEYKQIIKKDLNKINQFLKEFYTRRCEQQDLILVILQVGVSICLNSTQQQKGILKLILDKGIQNIFQPIEQDFVKPSIIKCTVPTLLTLKKSTISPLVRIIQEHIKLVLENKFSLNEQKAAANIMKKIKNIEKLQHLKDQLIFTYEKSILHLQKPHNIFEYLNKNNLQLIIPFINAKELNHLILTNKSMKQMINQVLRAILERLKFQRVQTVKSLNIESDFITAFIYLQHFQWFYNKHQGIISSQYFLIEPIGEMFKVLGKLFMRRITSMEYFFTMHQQNVNFEISHDLSQLNFTRGYLIDNILQKYTDNVIQERKFLKEEEKQYLDDVIYLQKYLKGLQILIKLNPTPSVKDHQLNNYMQYLFKKDKLIHQYERFNNSHNEILNIFTHKLIPLKEFPRQYFSRKFFRTPIIISMLIQLEQE